MKTIHENDTNLSRTLACLHQIDFLFLSHLLLLSLFIKSIKETMSSSHFCLYGFSASTRRFSQPLSRYRDLRSDPSVQIKPFLFWFRVLLRFNGFSLLRALRKCAARSLDCCWRDDGSVNSAKLKCKSNSYASQLWWRQCSARIVKFLFNDALILFTQAETFTNLIQPKALIKVVVHSPQFALTFLLFSTQQQRTILCVQSAACIQNLHARMLAGNNSFYIHFQFLSIPIITLNIKPHYGLCCVAVLLLICQGAESRFMSRHLEPRMQIGW